MEQKPILYYPRRMKTGWCIAHEITAAGVKLERYGTKYRTYNEAYQAAERMNARKTDEELKGGKS